MIFKKAINKILGRKAVSSMHLHAEKIVISDSSEMYFGFRYDFRFTV